MSTPTAGKLTFNKKERLKSKKLIDLLFREGSAISVPPIKVLWHFCELTQDVPVQVGVAVSKRNIKKAVDRNRVKRLIREAYRLKKLSVSQKLIGKGNQMALMLIYTKNRVPEWSQVENAVSDILEQLESEV